MSSDLQIEIAEAFQQHGPTAIMVVRIVTFNDISFVFHFILLIVNAFFDVLIIVDNELRHSKVITDDCLRSIID
jgi:hypothetical protein